MSEEFILEYEIPRPTFKKWRMGLSIEDREWLREVIGDRAKNDHRWVNNLGEWQYLGARPVGSKIINGVRQNPYLVRVKFRSKQQAVLFKLARLGDI